MAAMKDSFFFIGMAHASVDVIVYTCAHYKALIGPLMVGEGEIERGI